jgi:hypothetical protein
MGTISGEGAFARGMVTLGPDGLRVGRMVCALSSTSSFSSSSDVLSRAETRRELTIVQAVLKFTYLAVWSEKYPPQNHHPNYPFVLLAVAK